MLGGLARKSSLERPSLPVALVELPRQRWVWRRRQEQNLTQAVHLVGLWDMKEEPEEGPTKRYGENRKQKGKREF